jgi:hypothetical protein
MLGRAGSGRSGWRNTGRAGRNGRTTSLRGGGAGSTIGGSAARRLRAAVALEAAVAVKAGVTLVAPGRAVPIVAGSAQSHDDPARRLRQWQGRRSRHKECQQPQQNRVSDEREREREPDAAGHLERSACATSNISPNPAQMTRPKNPSARRRTRYARSGHRRCGLDPGAWHLDRLKRRKFRGEKGNIFPISRENLFHPHTILPEIVG